MKEAGIKNVVNLEKNIRLVKQSSNYYYYYYYYFHYYYYYYYYSL
jgi:hypothetical protein